MPSFTDIKAEQWDATAEEYAQMPIDGLMSLPLKRLVTTMDTAVPFSSATGILDVGCGPGVATRVLIRDYENVIPSSSRFVASDYSKGMIEQVNLRKKEMEGQSSIWKNLETKVMDAQDLSDIEDGSMSHVLGSMVYFALPDPRKGVQAAKRVLKPGGVFAFTTFCRNDWMEVMEQAAKRVKPEAPSGFDVSKFGNWSKTQGVKEELEAAGFKDVKVEEVEMTPPPEAVSIMGPMLIRSKNPGAKMVLEGFTEAEIEQTCEEWAKLSDEKDKKLVGIAIVASGRK